MTTIGDLLYDVPRGARSSIRQCLTELGIIAALPAPIVGLHDLADQLADAIASFLDMPIGNLLFAAWRTEHAVQQACQDTRGKGGATATVSLLQQTLTSTQRPTIEIEAAGQHFRVLELVLSLTIRFDFVPITVCEGHVIQVGTSTAASTAELGIAAPGDEGVHPLASKALPHLTLPAWKHPLTTATTSVVQP